jgi:Asp-tRNA(Asn)/Glu-tRNA(Gln) amidotransferase A subunit family amidase
MPLRKQTLVRLCGFAIYVGREQFRMELLKDTMRVESITSLPASGIVELIRQRKLSPVEVMDAHLLRIEQLNPRINAFVCVDGERAQLEAKRAEAALMRGAEGKPLLGVPITIKACIDVQGLTCEAGSRLRGGFVADRDATLVARLKNAGAIVIGNTTTPEFLMAYHTENVLHGRTNNPWDLTRTPGGSSGGEAAAIACGMSAAGIGSDGGGSIRVPAHFCGICGLKPTPGRIPATGHYPPCGGPFSLIGVVGPMARTIEDLQLLLAVTAGYDHGDPASAPVPLGTTDELQAKKLRIGYYEEDGYSSPTEETRAAIRSAARALQQAGFEVEAFRPQALDQARELWSVLFVDASAMVLKPMVEGREGDISNNMKEFLALAAKRPSLTGDRLLHTLLERDRLRFDVLAQMEQFPILLSPVCSTPAFPHEDGGWGAARAADYLRTMTYSQHYNLLGNPAAVVPIGKSPEGLPIGVQIIGRPYKEDEVLAVASVLDRQLGWLEPPVA